MKNPCVKCKCETYVCYICSKKPPLSERFVSWFKAVVIPILMKEAQPKEEKEAKPT